MDRLENLLTNYTGPMVGRNRSRVFNHVKTVTARLQMLEELTSDQALVDVLARHHEGSLTTRDALRMMEDQLARQAGGAGESLSRILTAFVQRLHIEWHPCDACNLCCKGCSYFQDTGARPEAKSFPAANVGMLIETMQPEAITIVGGGEPFLYNSDGLRFGDLVCHLGRGEFGPAPSMGVISNGTLWPAGDPAWPQYVSWIRYSLDAANAETYANLKGRDGFEQVVDMVKRTLLETNVPLVGVGFLYSPQNVMEMGDVVKLFGDWAREQPEDMLRRLNIQFRPFREPRGRVPIDVPMISIELAEAAAERLVGHLSGDPFMERFVRQNTNAPVNLMVRGARTGLRSFKDCYYGLAKAVVRADGSIWPCFRMGAHEDQRFCCGNIISDSAKSIALRMLYVLGVSARRICAEDPSACFFCVFNNMLERGLVEGLGPDDEVKGDYFF